jgi:5-methylcytosine-specific restriction endonuclease McrA
VAQPDGRAEVARRVTVTRPNPEIPAYGDYAPDVERMKPKCSDPTKRIRNADAAACANQVATSPSCSCCGTTEDLTADHRRPVSRGGTAADGLTTLCRRCNASKGRRRRCRLDHTGER